ncbi:ribonuclease H-like protein, partial [Heliocybe sulcata]
NEAVHAFTDGACLDNGSVNARAGSGVFFGPNDHRNISSRLLDSFNTNNAGEIAAVLLLTKAVDSFAPIHFESDSRLVVNGLARDYRDWEDRNYVGVRNAALWRPLVAALRARSAPTTFSWIKGHANLPGNIKADALAGAGARRELADHLDLSIDSKWNLSGAKLTTMTQALAYKAIQASKRPTVRRATLINLDIIRHAVNEYCGILPTDEMIWKSLRHKDLPRNIQDFNYKAVHGAYHVGPWWSNIRHYEHRAICQHCQIDDMLEHILTDCSAPGQKEIWAIAKAFWLQKWGQWKKPTFGLIFGCNMVHHKSATGARVPGVDRLFRIMMTESAFLIWKMRCERVISHPDEKYTKNEILNRWKAAISKCLTMDQALTNVSSLGKQALSRRTVLQTWSHTLQDEIYLPDDWITTTGVLMGIHLPEPWRFRRREPP